MPDTAVQIEGLNRFIRTCKAAGVDMSEFAEASRETANIVVYGAMSRAPKRTGNLAATIRAGRTKNRVVVYAGNAGAPYAAPIHWGWPGRNIEPQPFILDAMRASEPVWTGFYERELEKIVDSIEGV